MTQSEWILRELKRGRMLTALDALKGCGSMKLATRVSELKRQGHNIVTEIVSKNGKKFARYSLIKGKTK
jgi:hypothetical protein